MSRESEKAALKTELEDLADQFDAEEIDQETYWTERAAAVDLYLGITTPGNSLPCGGSR